MPPGLKVVGWNSGDSAVNTLADSDSPYTGAVASSSVPSEKTTFSGTRIASIVVVAEPAAGLVPSMVKLYVMS